MFTSIDKAIVALIMGALYILNSVAGIDIGLDEETISTILGVLTPILVYLVPNLKSRTAVTSSTTRYEQ